MLALTHQSSGDLLYIERPEVGGDANCYGDGWEHQLRLLQIIHLRHKF